MLLVIFIRRGFTTEVRATEVGNSGNADLVWNTCPYFFGDQGDMRKDICITRRRREGVVCRNPPPIPRYPLVHKSKRW